MTTRRRAWLGLGLSLSLVGCGFRLRGNLVLPFQVLKLEAPAQSPVVAGLLMQLQSSGVRVLTAQVAQPTPATTPAATAPDVVLRILQDQRERVVVGTTATGQVRELQLRQRLRFTLTTPTGRTLLATTEVLQERDLSFSETQVLGKEMEEALLYQDMQNAVVRQVMQRLAALKL